MLYENFEGLAMVRYEKNNSKDKEGEIKAKSIKTRSTHFSN